MSQGIKRHSAGRPISNLYAKLGYVPQRCTDTLRLGVLCTVCNRVLRNSASQRMLAHRNTCKLPKVSSHQARDKLARGVSPTLSESRSASPDREAASPSAPGPSHSFVAVEKPEPFKKIKLSHEVPFTEGYLDESSNYEPKKREVRRKSRTPPPPPPRPRISVRKDQETHICSSCPCVAAMENEYDKIGKAWASELKLMRAEQQIFAKRAIAEILFEGQLGGLNRNSVQIRRERDPFVADEPDFVFEKSEPSVCV